MSKLKDPRTVKIFFSSPFGGMEEEREELTRRYFPIIQHLCHSHGLQFAAIDMRWGITSELSDKAQVINICLREIDRSDMFIGFFGQRYGWHGSDDSSLQKNFDNAISRYPWLDTMRDKSVTELEFAHGFLNGKDRLPAALFFRDKSYDDKMRAEGVAAGNKKQVSKYSAESDLSVRLMDDLKHRVDVLKGKSLGVYMDYKTPAEAAKIMYDTIMDYLKNTLLVDIASKKTSAREEMKGQHDAFLASRANIFVHGELYMQTLDKQLLSESHQHVLVTGEAGCGKSALVCNWIKHIQHEHPNISLVYHFIGFADRSAAVNSMLSRVVGEFEHMASAMLDGTPEVKEDDKDRKTTSASYSDDIEAIRVLVHKLVKVMEQLIGLGKMPVLVLDGLEKIISTSQIRKVLYWLPRNLPKGSLVVVSTPDADTVNIEELKTREFINIHIEPLPLDSQHDLCVKTLEASGKELSPEQLERIVAADMTKNPLFLKITMSELITFGYFRLLDKKIDKLITADSIVSLFGQVISRLEEDYNVGDFDGNLVEKVMCSLQLSTHGLFEREIQTLFDIPDHVWSPFYFAIERLIIHQSGRIQFGFRELGEAVIETYLKDTTKRDFYLKAMIDFFQADLASLKKTTLLDGDELDVCRPALELPELLLQLGDIDGLGDCLSDFFVFSHLQNSNEYHLMSLWQQTHVKGEELVLRLLKTFDIRLSEIYVNMAERGVLENSETPGLQLVEFLRKLDSFLDKFGFQEISGDGTRRSVIERSIKIINDGLQHKVVKDRMRRERELHVFMYKLACILCQSRHTAQQGVDMHLQCIKDIEADVEKNGISSHNSERLGNGYHGIGVGYMTLCEYEKSIEYCQKSIDQHGTGDRNNVAISQSLISLAHMHMKQYDEAIELVDNAVKALEEVYFGEEPPIIGELLTNKALCLRRIDKLEEAEAVYQKSLEVKIRAVGREHVIVAMAYMNLGTLEQCRKNTAKALEYSYQAREIYETIGKTWANNQYILIRENIMLFYLKDENFEKIDMDFMEILDWRVEDNSLEFSLPYLLVEMTKYYIRSAMFEKAYKTACAILDTKLRSSSDGAVYSYLGMALEKLPPSYKENLPTKFSLKVGVEDFPDNVGLLGQYVRDYLLPENNADEIVRLVKRLHSGSREDGIKGVDVYRLTLPWCTDLEGTVNDVCHQRLAKEGLSLYPDDMDLELDLAKSYFRTGEADKAFFLAEKVAKQQMDNSGLVRFAAQMAANAQKFDVCKEYCQHFVDNFPEDEKLEFVKTMLAACEEAMLQKEESDDNPTADNGGTTAEEIPVENEA